MTQPKQWNSATQRHKVDLLAVKPSTSPDAKPLFRMFRLDSITRRSGAVVPDVYCILMRCPASRASEGRELRLRHPDA